MISGHAEYWSLRASSTASRRPATPASTSPPSAPTPPTGRSATRTAAARSSVTRRSRATAPSGSGAVSANDWGPTASRAPPTTRSALDGIAGTADDHPENSTTTFRDNGAPPGDPNAPPGGRVGPDKPENSLFGVMYVGDNDAGNYPLTIPAGERQRRVRRRPHLAQHRHLRRTSTTTIGTNLVGWEWDAIPTQAQYLAQQPAGVKRADADRRRRLGQHAELAPGRGPRYAHHAAAGPARLPSTPSGTRAPSGAWVFAAGTNQWADGLGRRSRLAGSAGDLQHPLRHGRAAGDAGRRHLDPAGSNKPPTASFTAHARTRCSSTSAVTFNASASTRPRRHDRQVRVGPRRQRDLRDQHRHDPDRHEDLHAPRATIDVRLRVTDNGGATDSRPGPSSVIGNIAPTASFTAIAEPGVAGPDRDLQRLRLQRPRRHDRQVRVGPRRQRDLRDQHRHHADDDHDLRDARAPYRSACA